MKTIAGIATVAVFATQIGCHTKARVDNSNETAKPNPAQTIPLLRAHAHNDYEHSRPLFDALAYGFTSIEVDFFLVNGHLCVAHDIKEIDTTRTLQSLYLEPLMNLVRQNGGWLFQQPVQLTLLIDLKSEARSSYLALRPVLHEYKEMLTAIAAGERQLGPIIVILTGNVAHELVLSDSLRYAEIDGRFEDWRRDFYPPLVSEDWQKLFKWNGEGEMPEVAQQRLRKYVETAHEHGQRIRFWSTPDEPSIARDAVWQALLAAGVDLINTDDLAGLRDFLITNDPQITRSASELDMHE